MILFSIVIPAYNVEKYIANTLESICKNDKEKIEIIVVDDGSTDNTWEKINESLMHYNPPFFKKIRQENQGVSVARNVGINNATGKYIIFCDGDDICKANMIETLCKYATEEWEMLIWRYDITQSEQCTISQNEFKTDRLYGMDIFKCFLLGENRIRLGSFAVRTDVIKKYGLEYTEGCVLSQDVEFIFKCLSRVKNSLFINDVLFTYAKREGSVMYKYNLNRFEAPRMVKRINEYVRNNTTLLEDNEIRDYLQNGFLIQHCMFAFDSCIIYLNKNNIGRFFNQYTEKYSDVENEIKRACSDMKIYPKAFSRKKVRIFCLSRKIYVKVSFYVNVLKHLK